MGIKRFWANNAKTTQQIIPISDLPPSRYETRDTPVPIPTANVIRPCSLEGGCVRLCKCGACTTLPFPHSGGKREEVE